MALPITPTPILRGKEAEAFERKAEANKNKCASKRKVFRALKIFEAVCKKNKKNPL